MTPTSKEVLFPNDADSARSEMGGSDYKTEPARADDLTSVLELVDAAGLPIAGVADTFPNAYVLVRSGNPIIAVAGLETHGHVGLLRSVAVAPAHQNKGIARQLVEDRITAGRSLGLEVIYVLTTTAADYFRRLGFKDTARQDAPALLQRSSEFASVCPSSSACLSLPIAKETSHAS